MTRPTIVLAVLGLALAPVSAVADEPMDDSTLLYYNTPPAVNDQLRASKIRDDHTLDLSINPFFQRGDFDGDKKADFAIGLVRTSDKERRLLVVRGKGKLVWLDPDDKLEYPTRDGWYVHDRKVKVGEGATGGKPPRLKGDALMIFKAEASSSLVYWNGKRFVSYWQGD